ncbi:MAG: TrmH family RNA methyltransferase [Patescibacteria group bacterium]|nr:TrmH family RNA methyltransferase [Patescibacteria group bacterium]
MEPVSLILHDIRSSENVGSMFRTADAAGVSKIYLTGYTPAPLDRFGRKNAKLAKAALGAEEFVPWEKRNDIFTLISELKTQNVRIVAVEQDSAAVPYMELRRGGSTAFILGNEVDGVPRAVLDVADAIVEIPMHGKKESLNVAVAAGIILFDVQ